jgi:hypothetical protein
MDVRTAVTRMVNSIQGKWVVAAVQLGMTENSLRNRVYELKGQSLSTSDALALQEFSGTTCFAEAIATASGGTFVRLPDAGEIENDSIHAAIGETYRELGRIYDRFEECSKDGKIDERERAELEALGAELHRKAARMQALMFHVYCPRKREVLLPVKEAA